MSRPAPQAQAQDKEPWPGMHARGDGALGFTLSKHLAGSRIKISEEEFIAWALEGTVLDDERKFALYEALINMDAAEGRIALFDGRAPAEKIAQLVVQVGADDCECWNNLLSWAVPGVEIKAMDPDLQWVRDKLALWGDGEDGVLF